MSATGELDPDAAAAAGSGIFGLPHTPEGAKVVLVPVPWDATTSYRAGTARGPAAILEASRQVDLFDVETGRPYRQGIAMLPIPGELDAWNREARALAEPIIEAGGVAPGDESLVAAASRVDALGEAVNAHVREQTERWLDAGRIVGVVGGDHSTPFGAIAAIAERNPGIGILHLDAHADLREAFEGLTWSHASIMRNVVSRIPRVSRLVQVGVRDLGEAEHAFITGSSGRVATFFDAELAAARFAGRSWRDQCADVVAALPQTVWLSWDIDGLDPALCPHTGTPVPGGLSFQQASFLLRAVAESGRRIAGFDLVEVAPGPDGGDWDANVGARLLYKMIGWTLRSGDLGA